VSLFTFLLLFPAMLFVPEATAAFKYLHEGMKCPDVKGEDILSGTKVSSRTVIDDKNLVVIVFWATWSERSLQELQALKEISLQAQDLPLKIIAVNVEGQQLTAAEKSKVVDLTKQMELPFPVLMDDGLKTFYEFGVIAVPSTAIVDTTGVLRYAPAGFSLTTRDLIADSIDVLLGRKEAGAAPVIRPVYTPVNEASRYYHLALRLSHKRMYERALSNLERAQEADSQFASPHALRGEIFLKLDSTEAAIREYQTAVQLDSTLVAAWAGLGKALLAAGKPDEAIQALSKALELDDSFTPAFLDLGLSLASLGRTTEALDSLSKAIELHPKDPLGYYYQGKVYARQNDLAAALTSYQKALQLLYPPSRR
jgi:tetratricopeptide (TPR) repeat protein